MAVDLKKGNQYIRSKGGNKWSYKRVKSDGSNLTVPDSWHDGVYREKSTFTFEKPEVMIYNESGDQVASTYDNVNISLVITSLQDDVNLENFLVKETEDSYFSIVMAGGDATDTTNKVRWFPICRIATKYSVDAPGRRPDITIIPQYNDVEEIVENTFPTWCSILDGKSILAGEYYKVYSVTNSSIL